ncbi:MAG: hypothetical protein IPK26_09950 [Planctomycetes bacterium]|nr:hypothetical protein [Planctomycetota bacterium]
MTWDLAVVLHAAVTWFLGGLIWFVQLVHYPLFAAVGTEAFVAYEREHCRRTNWIVLPTMTAEAILAGALWWFAPGELATATMAGLVALAAVWASTFLIQVPCHRRLAAGAHPPTIRRLVGSNWLRTAAWSVRALIAAVLLLARGPT